MADKRQQQQCAFCGKRRPASALMPYAVKGGVIRVCASTDPKTGATVNNCEE